MKTKIILITLLLCSSLFATVPPNETINEFFDCDGDSNTFTFTIPAYSASDIKVRKIHITDGNMTPLVQDVDYTIASTGGSYLNGGVVTTISVIPATYKLEIYRQITISQETSSASVNPISITNGLDKLTRITRDLQNITEANYTSLDHSFMVNLDYGSTGHTGFEPTVTKGNITAGSGKISITGGTGAVIGSGVSLDINESDFTNKGDLTSADNKLDVNNGTGAVLGNGTILTIDEGYIDHDLLTNWIADKHIAHSDVNIDTTLPLGGGGNIAATKNISVGGLSTLGTAKYLVTVNGDGTGWQYKQLVAGPNTIIDNNSTSGKIVITAGGGSGSSAVTVTGYPLTLDVQEVGFNYEPNRLWVNNSNNLDVNVSAIDHNGLRGLQGGTTDEYYHLTAGQNAALHNSVTAIMPLSIDPNQTPIFLRYDTNDFEISDNNDLRLKNSVRTTGNETIAGVKTFTSIPILPNINPTNSQQAVRKIYCDAKKSGDMVQFKYWAWSDVLTGTSIIPADNTIPEVSEGNEIMGTSLDSHNTSTSNTLKVDVVVHLASTAAGTLTATLCDGYLNAVVACGSTYCATVNKLYEIKFTYYCPTAGHNDRPFTVRVGNSVAGTVTFNGVSGAGLFGGVLASSIAITEIQQ